MNDNDIVIIDAIPAFADVFSGATPRPTSHNPADPTQRAWWHWAVKTHAGRRALKMIGCDIDVEQPWNMGAGHWRTQPWDNPGVENPHYPEVAMIRDILGEPGAGTFYAEIAEPTYEQPLIRHRRQTLIAINQDGTRAAVWTLRHWQTYRD